VIPKSRLRLNPWGSDVKKILLIEDDVELARFLAWQLEQNNYQALVAHSGPEGLALLQAQRPDLILLDLMLPGMDGWEVLRAIRDPRDHHQRPGSGVRYRARPGGRRG